MAQQGIDLKLDKWETQFYAKMQLTLFCTTRKMDFLLTGSNTNDRLGYYRLIGKMCIQE